MYTLYITFSQSSWTGLFVVLSLLTASIIHTTFAFAFWNYFWTTRGRPEWNVKQWSFNYLLGRQVNFKQHPARMWSQFVLCGIILSFCLPSSCFVSPALVCLLSDSLSANGNRKAVASVLTAWTFILKRGKSCFHSPEPAVIFSPKKASPCPRPPPLPFLSLFQLKSCLLPCLHAVSFAEMH